MKTRILLFSFFFFFCADAFSQSKKLTDYIKNDQLYLTWNNHNISFGAIKNTTIIKLLGKPIKIKKEKSEVTDLMVITYFYTDGEIYIEDGELTDIDIKKTGWAFSFKNKKVFTGSFTIGSDINKLIKLFPKAYYKSEKGFSFEIYNCDCSVGFDTERNKIKKAGFFTNDS